METKETADTQAAEAVKNAKSTRNLLDEARELYQDGYVTENEFRIARVNILKEGGIDVVTRLQHARRPLQEEEDDSKGGCGCFLISLLLTVFIVLGLAFFAAPYWPDRLGGAEARATREWFTVKGTELIDRFFGKSTVPAHIPDPAPAYTTPEGEQPVPADEPLTATPPVEIPPPIELSTERVGNAAPVPVVPLSPDMHILSLPSDIVEAVIPVVETYNAVPATDVTEIQTPVLVDPNTALYAGNALRGYITVPNARIRSVPDTSTQDNVVGWGRSGDRFTVLEEGSGSDGSKWYNIIYEDESKRGWISGSLVSLEQ